MYYIISFICCNNEYFCIWVSDDEDYVLSNSAFITSFTDINSLIKYAKDNDILVEDDDITKYNIDKMLIWCEDPFEQEVNCDEIINFWNICTDVAKGRRVHFVGTEKEYNPLYEKIFLGNNITHSSERKYVPIFSFDEIKTLKSIFKEGINLITRSLKKQL